VSDGGSPAGWSRSDAALAHQGPGHDARWYTERFPAAEVEAAFQEYLRVGCGERDWERYADMFHDDAVYVEHEDSVHEGREAIRAWIVPVMAGLPSMTFEVEWWQIQGNRCTVYIWNRMADVEGKPTLAFMNMSIVYYGGDGRFRFQEDVINTGFTNRAMAEYFRLGGAP